MRGLQRLALHAVALLAAAATTAATLAGTGAGTAAASDRTADADGTTTAHGEQAAADDQPWVRVAGGHLVYREDAQGNRIPDFSHAGYGGGGVAIPNVPVRRIVAPSGGPDDTASIQAALDEVAARTPDRAGIRGAVLLRPGDYHLAGVLQMNSSGVVLRGSGPRTRLVAEGRARTLIRIEGTGQWEQVGDAKPVTDEYVPVGARSFHVADPSGLAVGDRVIVQRPFETDWIHAIGMDAIPPRPDGTPSTPWPPGPGLFFDRTVTAVSGSRITVDVPLTNALEQEYAHSTVWKYTFPGRISNVGVERLTADGAIFGADPSYPVENGYFDSQLVRLDAVENAWVRDVSAAHFGQPYGTGSTALRVTMSRVSAPEILVPQTISNQPAAWSISGQQILVQHCSVTGSNYHAWITQSRVPGPNVYSDCEATNTGTQKLDAGPHQRWATGVLFDRVRMSDTGALLVQNRTWMGSGQGWAAANSVLWNCEVGTYRVDGPPTAHNWAIGCRGEAQIADDQPPGIIQSAGEPVAPASLYTAQLQDRMRDR